MSSDLISQDVVPIGTGYLILMGVLAAGLRLQRRDAIRARAAEPGAAEPGAAEPGAAEPGAAVEPGEPGSGGKKPGALARRVPAGWPRLAVQVGSVALGGYLLLMAVDVLYYYGVAKVAGQFIESAFTGGLTLIAIALPLFALATWLSVRRKSR
jgi:hypothetical protein